MTTILRNLSPWLTDAFGPQITWIGNLVDDNAVFILVCIVAGAVAYIMADRCLDAWIEEEK